jgi:dTDP-4-dehydrorhamnose 3,5-epimerase
MKVTPTSLSGVLLLQPDVFGDARGFFLESYNQRRFNEAAGQELGFVQDNHSRSSKGVLRGLHYQRDPHAQGKLIRVIAGEIFDVAVDLREGSATLGQWFGRTLSADLHEQLWIPPGFAHGFLVLSETADVAYKTTDYYNPQAEVSMRWDDPDVAIAWPDTGVAPKLAAKDLAALSFRDAPKFAACHRTAP